MPSNLFFAGLKGSPVNSAIFLQTITSNVLGAFSPVPTTVPPIGSSDK